MAAIGWAFSEAAFKLFNDETGGVRYRAAAALYRVGCWAYNRESAKK
jgi:uncharacterized protein (DUF697 family)